MTESPPVVEHTTWVWNTHTLVQPQQVVVDNLPQVAEHLHWGYTLRVVDLANLASFLVDVTSTLMIAVDVEPSVDNLLKSTTEVDEK